jgi:hypothetical protein
MITTDEPGRQSSRQVSVPVPRLIEDLIRTTACRGSFQQEILESSYRIRCDTRISVQVPGWIKEGCGAATVTSTLGIVVEDIPIREFLKCTFGVGIVVEIPPRVEH